jgi:predicted nucleic acid-binding protein
MPNSSIICCDANLIANWTMREELDVPETPIDRWLRAKSALSAPALLHFEISNVLYRAYRAKHFSLRHVRDSVRIALALPIRVFDDDDLHFEALAIADRFNLPATYDAHYLALAEREDAEFWTSDTRLFNTIRHQLPWAYLSPPEPKGA